MNTETRLYKARKIITMDTAIPTATHVALNNGRIVDIGDSRLEKLYGEADDTFSESVITPGFVEGHAHVQEGMIWKLPYVGFFDRRHPDGQNVKGCDTVEKLVDQLKETDASLDDDNETLFAWGYDAIYFPRKPMRKDLDTVSTTRPVVLIHSNLHLITVNSVALELAGINKENTVDGVYLDDHGEPNGELAEFAAMFPVFHAVGNPVFGGLDDADGLRRFGQSCHLAGITTCADLYNDLAPEVVDVFESVTAEDSFPVRVVSVLGAMQFTIPEVIERVTNFQNRGNDKLRLGSVKMITDGSIQGFSARVRQPYFNGIENGVWFEAPAQMQKMITAFHNENIKLQIHVNGDESAELVLQTFEKLIPEVGRKQRHVLQHCQMMDRDQLVRASKLGLVVNMFANHTYFWGDQHREISVGPEIAKRMNAARTALDVGLKIAIHCDAPVSPLGPLFTAWCAVNRRTASGKEHGPDQCISPEEALHAITMGAAVSLDLENEIGSISIGKRADFTILDKDPLSVDPMTIRDIAIVGTVVSGKWQSVE